MKIISWNLLRRVGATPADVVDLVRHERPDLLLLQEATRPFEALREALGGSYSWSALPGRIHGLAMWSPTPWASEPVFTALSPGAWVERIGQTVVLGEVGIANVHLSHGQRLNRRQLRDIATHLPERAAVLGDYNLVGPALLPGFRDVGPRWPTHRMSRLVPLRIDRCLVRGLVCEDARVLPRRRSDHRPICVRLAIEPANGARPGLALKYKEAAASALRRATGRARPGTPAPGPAGDPPGGRA